MARSTRESPVELHETVTDVRELSPLRNVASRFQNVASRQAQRLSLYPRV